MWETLDLPLLAAFVAACTVLAATPGPGVFYVVTRTVADGRRIGLASVAGVALGNLGNAAGASLGLAALFAVSSVAFTVVKWAGAGYLFWLALQALHPVRESSPAIRVAAEPAPQPALRPAGSPAFRDGVLVALLNPKTALFFAAFMPQFIPPGAPPVVTAPLFGLVFVAIAAATDAAWVLLADRIAARWRADPGACLHWARRGRYLTAVVYVALGVNALMASRAPSGEAGLRRAALDA